jgi:hypothetical protein
MRCAEALGVAVADLMSETTGERPPLLIIMFLIASIISGWRENLGKKLSQNAREFTFSIYVRALN